MYATKIGIFSRNHARCHKMLAQKLQDVLESADAEAKALGRAFIADKLPELVSPDITKEEYRTLVTSWLRSLTNAGYTKMPYPEEYGGSDENLAYMAIVETLCHYDMSLAVKQGVNFGLFGLAVSTLGSDKHGKQYLPDLISGKLYGGFAMTEIAGGSDVQSVATEAVYDHATRSFTLNTPHPGARKAYIGNAAKDGQMMVVFAQLKMNKETESRGVHAFLVPVRDSAGNLAEGIDIEDCGHKIGLNGVDNGYLSFKNVTIPYDGLLDKYATIDADGKYSSPIEKKSKRFFTMISTLVTGRIFVSLASLSGIKNALTAAVRFADERVVFGDKLLDKQASQSRLMPHLAQAYALHFATRTLLQKGQEKSTDLETLAAAIKPRASDAAFAAIDEGRKISGGFGYMSEARYGQWRNDVDIFRTFEGDNTVLRLLVARNRLGEFASSFNRASTLKKIKTVFNRKAAAVNIARYRRSEKHLLDSRFQTATLAQRESMMLYDLARKLRRLHKKYGASAINMCQDDMIAYAEAYTDRIITENFVRAVGSQTDPEVKKTLKNLCDAFALDAIRRNGMWHIMNRTLSARKMKAVESALTKLQSTLAADARSLVEAFAIPEKALPARTSAAAPRR